MILVSSVSLAHAKASWASWIIALSFLTARSPFLFTVTPIGSHGPFHDRTPCSSPTPKHENILDNITEFWVSSCSYTAMLVSLFSDGQTSGKVVTAATLALFLLSVQKKSSNATRFVRYKYIWMMNQVITLLIVDNHRMDSDLCLVSIGWLDFFLRAPRWYTHDFVNCFLIRSVWSRKLTISLWNCFSK